MSSLPRISEAEWSIMRVLWDKAPRTAGEVVEAVAAVQGWQPRTVKTLLGRLVKKGAVRYTAEGRTFYYAPAVSEDTCVRAEGRSFLRRVFNGSLSPMLTQFIEETPLSEAEIRELRQLLEKKGGHK